MTIDLALTKELLSPAVQQSLEDDQILIKEFQVKALKPGAGNPTSLGVYRVFGTAATSNGDQSFSVVVKHLANGLPMLDASEENYWNYWLREPRFFESPLVSLIPKSIGYPKYLGQSRLPDGTALFWNADLGDLEKANWTWGDCLAAAKVVAELNSAKTSNLAEFTWLNQTQVEGWAELHLRWGSFTAIYPTLKKLGESTDKSKAAMKVIGPYLDHRNGKIEGLLKGGRQSFVHGDFNLNNLVPARGARQDFVALDWQLCGVARLGTEVAAIFNTAIEHGLIAAETSRLDELCVAYTESFNELNPNEPVELNEVRVAASAMGFFICVGLGMFLCTPDPQLSDQENRSRIMGLWDEYVDGPVLIYAQVLAELE